MKRREFLAGGLGISLFSSSLLLSSCRQSTADTKLAVAGNVPSTGDLGVYGNAIRNGSELALGALSTDHRRLLNLDWQDNAGDAARASAIARTQLAGLPDIVISGLKPQTAAIQPLVDTSGAIHFPWILDVAINRRNPALNFRIWVSFKLELEVFRSILQSKRPRRVALWFFNTEAGVEQYSRHVAPYCQNALGAQVLQEVIQSDSTNYHAVAARIAAFRPDIIFLNGFIPHMVSQIRALRPLGLIRPGQTVGSLDLLDAAAQLQPAEVEGIYVAAPAFVVDRTPAAEQWARTYQDRFRQAPSYHAAYAYDMMSAITRAGEKPLPADRAARIAELAQRLRSTAFEGITGPVRLDTDQSLSTGLRLCHFVNGRPVQTQA